MVITTIVNFMPCVISLMWALTFLIAKRTYRQNLLFWIIVPLTFYLFSFGLNVSAEDNHPLATRLEVVSIPLGLWCIAAFCLYVWVHISQKRLRMVHALAFLPSILFATIHTTLYFAVGHDTVVEMYRTYESTGHLPPQYSGRFYELLLYVNFYVSTLLAFVSFIVLLVLCACLTRQGGYRFGDFFRFMLKGQRSTNSRMISFCLMVASPTMAARLYFFFYPSSSVVVLALPIILSVALHFLFFAEYHSNLVYLDSNKVADLHNMVGLIKSKPAVDEEDEHVDCSINDTPEDELLDEEGNIVARRQYERTQGLLTAFLHLMEEERVYLDTDINIIDVAKRLNVGRTTLSMAINHEYNKNFRAVINDFRIEYAKHYMLQYPTETQEQIALECGFKEASSFSKKFKEIVGDTPLVWLMKQANVKNDA